MNNELKVSFYLKREGNTERIETKPDAIFSIVGKIIIGNTIAQFGSKLKIEERLWGVKSGRAIGKSRVAVELNREIDKINLSIHTHYKGILKRTGKVTAIEVKNAFQGIATAQKTLLVLFGEMMEDFKGRIGIDRAQSTYKQYEVLYTQPGVHRVTAKVTNSSEANTKTVSYNAADPRPTITGPTEVEMGKFYDFAVTYRDADYPSPTIDL